ncbi:MAG: O-antigen ligase family protein [bacterium]
MRKVTFWLSLALIFVIPLENAVFIQGLGRLSKAVGLVVAALWIATVMITGKARKPHPFHAVVILFVLWNALSIFWSVDHDRTMDRAITYTQLFVMVLVISDLYATPTALRAGLQAYILGAYIPIGSTIYNYFHASQFYYQRYAGAGLHVNDLGLILALGIPVAWYLTLIKDEHGKKSYRLTLINYAYIPAATLAILLTASRGAVIAAMPAFLFIFLSLNRFKLHIRFLLFVMLAGSLLAVLPFVPESSFERLAVTDTVITEGGLNGRSAIWREGFALFIAHPLLGVGSGAFRTAATETGQLAHNFVLSLLVEIGIIGFILYAIILAMAVYYAIHQPKWSCRLWLTVLMVWTIGAASHNWEHRKQTWLFLSLVPVGASAYVRRDEAGILVTPPDHSANWKRGSANFLVRDARVD